MSKEPEPDPWDALLEMDAELTEFFGEVNPEAFFKLGQAYPEAASLSEAVGKLYSLPDQAITDLGERYGKLSGKEPMTHDFFRPTDVENIPALAEEVANQIPILPDFIPLATWSGNESLLDQTFWLPLDEFERHPGRRGFRNQLGRRSAFPVREVRLVSALSYVIGLSQRLPEWVSMLVFASDAITDKTVKITTLGNETLPDPNPWVRFIVVFTREEPEEIVPGPPPWVRDHMDLVRRSAFGGVHDLGQGGERL